MRLYPRGMYLWALRLCESGERRPELARFLLNYFLSYGQMNNKHAFSIFETPIILGTMMWNELQDKKWYDNIWDINFIE